MNAASVTNTAYYKNPREKTKMTHTHLECSGVSLAITRLANDSVKLNRKQGVRPWRKRAIKREEEWSEGVIPVSMSVCTRRCVCVCRLRMLVCAQVCRWGTKPDMHHSHQQQTWPHESGGILM